MDYLDKLTQLAQVRGEINIRCLFQGDWQVEHLPDAAEYQGLFHLIEQGECWVTLAGKQFHLKKGDLFFLPQNRPHFLGSSQQKRENSLQKEQSNALFNVHQIGAGTPDLKMFCGTFYYQKPSLLIDSLPDYLHLSLQNTPVQPLVSLFLQEAEKPEQGTKSVIDALSNVLFIYILRHAQQIGLLNQGLLAALQDKRLNQVLEKILFSPQLDWNIEQLAELASMSRATFMRIFQQQLGMPPGKFLTQVRLEMAAVLLKNTQKTILAIALEVGYQSEAHFSKAFKAIYGLSPSQFRKT